MTHIRIVTPDLGRLIVHDGEIHLETFTDLAVGDAVEVIRGNGPREGDRIGTATVTGYEDGNPVLSVHLDWGEREAA